MRSIESNNKIERKREDDKEYIREKVDVDEIMESSDSVKREKKVKRDRNKEAELDEAEITEEEEQKALAKKKMAQKAIAKEILSNSIYILVVLALTLLIVKYVGQRTVVSGQSMQPTLYNNDNLIVDKISYRFDDPERFDIIVFPFAYEEKTYYIKRIIGMPGETVRIDEAGNIYIDGQILEENFGAEIINDPGMAYTDIVIGENQYFVLGDNRNHSSDSRTPAVGLINRNDIIGKAFIRIYPFNEFGLLKHE